MNTTQEETLASWIVEYPLCFDRVDGSHGLTYGLEYGEGWNAIVEELLEKIQDHLAEKYAAGFRDPDNEFSIQQIKQKFGILRVYVSGADDAIHRWIFEAERKSAAVCEMCGSPGSLHCAYGGYWLHTMCPHHAETHKFVPFDPNPSNAPESENS